MLSDISPSLGQDGGSEVKDSSTADISELKSSSPLIEDIDHASSTKKIVSSSRISTAIHRLKILTSSHPNPGLTKRLLRPVILPLWALSSWSDVKSKTIEEICNPARDLLRMFLQLASGDQSLFSIVQNLMFTGESGKWIYTLDMGEISISSCEKGGTQRQISELQASH